MITSKENEKNLTYMEVQYQVGDRVKVVSNLTNPSSVGKVGTIVKAVEGISYKTQQNEMLYKVQSVTTNTYILGKR